MKTIITLTLIFVVIDTFSQPSSFSWHNKDTVRLNFISSAKDQGEQGPCRIFAAVSAVEAMSHIYYNKPFGHNSGNGIDLAEREIYSWCSGFGGPLGSANIEETLHYIDTSGIINESCFPYPNAEPFYTDCSTMCSSPDLEVNIPGFEQLYLSNNQELKRAIIDYGPIATFLAHSGYELHGSAGDESHAVLIIGWDGSQWHIKDSWPGENGITYANINVFDQEYNALFYRVKYEHNGSAITCTGSGCNAVFSERSCTDNDGDGFYYWGIGPKPAGCPGPCQMDFNDTDPNTIFLDASYNALPAPTVSGPDYTCSSGTNYQLNDLPPDFTASWTVSPSQYFNSPTSGNGTIAEIYPKTLATGNQGTITFTVSDNCSSLQYSKTFTINMPEPKNISIDVVPSNAPDPIYYNEVWLLCPNSTYYIYLNNNSGCSTSNYQWNIPAGWTKYEQTGNYIRINTNDSPSAMITVSATTCCNTSHLIKTQYFGESYSCGGYFMVYPNPASPEINIEFDKTFDLKTVDKSTTLEIYDSGYSIKYKAGKIEKLINVKTDGWKDGFYYVILNHKGRRYYEKVKIEH
ncbi:MAG: C1 family peptidase [Mariniphaga sp.]